MAAIRLRAFQPLDPDGEVSESSGWCVMDRPFDLEFEPDKVFEDRCLVLGFRTDRFRVPPAMVRAQLADEQARLLSRKRELLEQKIAALRAEFAAEEVELHQEQIASDATRVAWEGERERMRSARGSANGDVTAVRTEKIAAPALAPASRKRNGSAAPRPQRA